MSVDWNEFWFRPASALSLRATRAIVSLNALWILLSRPDLPEMRAWPAEFWLGVDRMLAVRYLIFDVPPALERGLYALLHVSLLACVVGIAPRVSCFASALLLYHFAPFENVIWHGMGPYFSGLTLPVIALFALSLAEAPGSDAAASPEYRWPVALAQVFLAFNYSFAALSKLRTAGFSWVDGRNIEGMVMTSMTMEVEPPWARLVLERPWLCWAIAITTMAVELLFVLVPFSRSATRVLVPLAALAHIGIVNVLGIVFLSFPSLLIYVDWDALARRRATRAAAAASRAKGT